MSKNGLSYHLQNKLYHLLRQRLSTQWFSYARTAWHLFNPKVARDAAKRRHIVRTISAERGLVVQGGPFVGMRLIADIVDGYMTSKALLGSYESELHEAIERLMRNEYDRVVNVGSDWGYYAVGLALKLPNAKVYASDSSPYARELCRKTAELNGVSDRMAVIGQTDLRRLKDMLGVHERALIVMDCEGCELDLLRPELVPQLRTSDLIVELHDLFESPISEMIAERFAETHEMEVVDTAERDPDQFPVLWSLKADEREMAVAERRPYLQNAPRMKMTQWMVLTAK